MSGVTNMFQRSEYFSRYSRKDQLSLLSFWDRLRPGLLPDLLASISKRHPDLPIFNSPDWATQIASRPPPKRGLSVESGSRNNNKPASSSGTAPGIVPNGSPQIRSGTPGTPTGAAAPQPGEPSRNGGAESDVPVEDDDLLPATWPKHGEGFYVTLPLEKDDPLLVDGLDDIYHQGFAVEKDGTRVRPTSCIKKEVHW